MKEVVFRARGHPNISATHRSTFEITREDFLTPRGDCIIGVEAELACRDLPAWFKEALRSGEVPLVIELEVEGMKEVVNAKGSPRLSLASPTSMVIRRSDYIDDRTLAIKADKAARDLSRELVNRLKNRDAILTIRLRII